MGEKALWPAVVLGGVICAFITALVYSGMDTVQLIAVLGVVASFLGTVLTLFLYGKMVKVEQNTNGTLTNRDLLVTDLIEHAKTSVPLEVAAKVLREG